MEVERKAAAPVPDYNKFWGYVVDGLKAKKTHGFNSCIVISVYSLDILSIKKATEYRNNW